MPHANTAVYKTTKELHGIYFPSLVYCPPQLQRSEVKEMLFGEAEGKDELS